VIRLGLRYPKEKEELAAQCLFCLCGHHDPRKKDRKCCSKTITTNHWIQPIACHGVVYFLHSRISIDNQFSRFPWWDWDWRLRLNETTNAEGTIIEEGQISHQGVYKIHYPSTQLNTKSTMSIHHLHHPHRLITDQYLIEKTTRNVTNITNPQPLQGSFQTFRKFLRFEATFRCHLARTNPESWYWPRLRSRFEIRLETTLTLREVS